MGTSKIPPTAECLMFRCLDFDWTISCADHLPRHVALCPFAGSIGRLGIPVYVLYVYIYKYIYIPYTYMNMYEPSLGVMSLTQKGCNPRTAGLSKGLNVHVSIIHLRLNPLAQQIRLDLLCEIWVIARGQKHLAKHFQDVSWTYHWM